MKKNNIISITSHWGFGDHTTFVYEDKGKVSLEVDKELDGKTGEEEPYGYIFDLWVNEEYRKAGIASVLLEAAESKAKELGLPKVRLHWESEDTPKYVLEWYLRKGYKEIGFNSTQTFLEKYL